MKTDVHPYNPRGLYAALVVAASAFAGRLSGLPSAGRSGAQKADIWAIVQWCGGNAACFEKPVLSLGGKREEGGGGGRLVAD